MAEDDTLDTTSVGAAISSEIVRIHEDSYGFGAHHVETHLIADVVLVVLDVDLSLAERILLDHGRSETVRANRETFQAAIEPTFRAVVERATGRRVDAFLSHMHIEPTFCIELFRLSPQ
jgi:uncharacterized protein YbcI